MDEEYIDQLICDVSTMSRDDLLNQMDVPVDGHFNRNYNRNESLDPDVTLLGISDISRYLAHNCKEVHNTIIPIQNGHYYVSSELMDMYYDFADGFKDFHKDKDICFVH